MCRSAKMIINMIISICLMFVMSVSVLAKDAVIGFKTEKNITDELNAWAEENNMDVVFGAVHITPHDEMSRDEMEKAAESYVTMMKRALTNRSSKIADDPGVARATGSYRARVESMIPAIGWGYINQDFTANVSSSKISSVTLVGSSYDTGFTLGSWDPNYSWYVISSNKQNLEIYMKGTICYLWEGLNISQDATFLDYFKASGSTLVAS